MTRSEWLEALGALLSSETHLVANLANAAALLYEALPRINWAGFYLLDRGALWLGPFQGKSACVMIPWDKGVCGASFSDDKTLVVPDVHAFPGHIACDTASRSEIVVPLRMNGRAVGVLDIDSPEPDRFDENDRLFVEAAARLVESRMDWARVGYDLAL